MAEGIKIRSLDITNSLVDSDVLIIDNVTADDLTTAVTKQIRYDDFIADLTGRDLVFSGEVIFNADISFDGNVDLTVGELSDVTLTDLRPSQTLVYDGTQWINKDFDAGNLDYIALKSNSADASEDNIVHINVTVANKVNHRDVSTGYQRGFYLDNEEAPFLILTPGRTYMFHQDDVSNKSIDANNLNQFRLKIYPFRDKGVFGYPIEIEGFVEYSNEAPGTDGSYTMFKLIENYQYNTVYYQAEGEDRMGNGIFNPDGSEQFSIEPMLDSLQEQINLINEQLQDVIEIEQG